MRAPIRGVAAFGLGCALLVVPAGSTAQIWPATTVQTGPSRTIQAIQWRNMRWAQSIQARNDDLLRRNSLLMDRYRSQLGSMRSMAAPGQVVRVPMLSTRMPFNDAARRLSDMRYEHQQRLQRTILEQNEVALRERARRERTLLRYRAYNRHAVDHLIADLRNSVANGFELYGQLTTLRGGYQSARTGQELTRLRGEILSRQQAQRSMARQVAADRRTHTNQWFSGGAARNRRARQLAEHRAQTSRMQLEAADVMSRARNQLGKFALGLASLTPSGIAARLIRPPSQLRSVERYQRSYSIRTSDSYADVTMSMTSRSSYLPFGGINELRVVRMNYTMSVHR